MSSLESSIISMADNQSFDNQKDETLEDRLIIKANSDTFASTREISQQIAHMSADGNEDWKMKKVSHTTNHVWPLSESTKSFF